MIAQAGARLHPEAGTGPGGPAVLAHTTPYPWPYDAAFAPRRCALIVHDTADPASPLTDPAWDAASGLARSLRAAGGLVVTLHQHRPPRLGRRAPAGARGTSRAASDLLVEAPAWDGFHGTALDQELRSRGRDQLLLAGAWLEVGVHSTMRAANDRGYECLLLADACLSGAPELRTAALRSIEMSGGIFGAVGTATELSELLARATTDQDVIS